MLKFGSKKNLNSENKCTIRLLDDNEVIECEFQSYHKGRYLLDYVLNHLNLIESDYFGLRYVDQHKQRHWLDPNRNILRQMKGVYPLLVCFRVKFYPHEPLQLQEEVSRYQLFLQLRRDLLHGRLYCQQTDAAHLAALLLQAELGDHAQQLAGYVQQCRLLVRQTPKLEERIEEVHASLAGTEQAQAEMMFLKRAATLDTYGVDPHPVKDQKGTPVYLGLSHSGLLTFQGSRKTQHFRWPEIQRLNYEGKMFIAHITIMETKHTVGFKCSSASACKHVWRAAVEQRLFYTLPSSGKRGVVVTGGSFFSRGTRFKYQGRCEREAVLDSTGILREAPNVRRTPHLMPRSASLPTTPPHHGQEGEEDDVAVGHRPLPYIDRSTSLDEEVLCGGSPQPRAGSRSGPYCPESSLPPLLEPGGEGGGEAMDGPADLDEHEDAQALHQAWARGAYSRSHTLDLPDAAADTGVNYPTGSLPRHMPPYTPPSPHPPTPHHNTPQHTHSHHSTPQLPYHGPHFSSTSQLHPAAAATQLPAYTVHTLPHSGPHHSLASHTSQGFSPQLSYASVHSSYEGDTQHLHRNSPHAQHVPCSVQQTFSSAQDTPSPPPLSAAGPVRWSWRWRRVSAFAGVFGRMLVLVVVTVTVVAVCVLESKPAGLLHALRSRPEMVLLRLHYYQPVKESLVGWLGGGEEHT